MSLLFKTVIKPLSFSSTTARVSRLSSSIVKSRSKALCLSTVKSPKMSSSSWTCSKCTFINSPTKNSHCRICLNPQQTDPPSSSSSTKSKWSCSACTFLNPFSCTACEICGTRASASLISTLEIDELDEIEMGSSIGSVFFPLKGCVSTVGKENSDKDVGKNSFAGALRACNGKRKHREDDSTRDGVSDFDRARAVEVDDDDEVVEIRSMGGNNGVSSSESKGLIKILSYNVWFREDLEMHNRMKALGNLIRLHSPDVICFQEVTPNFYDIFKHTSWWKAYTCSIPNEEAFPGAYFCMQLSKLSVKSYDAQPFLNTIMGRQLHVARIETLSKIPLTVATSHLESPCPSPPTWDQMFSKERVAQAKEAVRILDTHKNVIFCGDMNWDDKLDGPFPISGDWIDAWTELKPGEVGFTYDTKSNKMLSGNRSLQKRLDRFFCRLKDFDVREIEMIGKNEIPGLSYVKEKRVKGQIKELELPVFPSDHFGLVLTITPK